MARRRTRTAKPNIPDKAASATGRFPTGLVISIILTLILGGIPFGLGKYIELNSPGPFDSGAYVYSAKHLLDGAQMGVDELPSARPETLIMNLIGVKLFGFNDIGPKIVQMTLQLAALVFMFITLRKCFGAVASVIGTAIAAVYLSAPVIAKFGNVKEQFMISFMIYAACSFLWYELTNKKFWLAAAGFFALQPYYFKPTGISVVFAIILYLLICRAIARQWKILWMELSLFLCGCAAGMIIPGSLYLWQGRVPSLLRSFPSIAIALGAGMLVLTGIPLAIGILAEKKNIEGLKKIPGWIWGITIILIVGLGIITQWNRILSAAGIKGGGYLANSLSARGLSELAPQVFRYYKALSVPMLSAVASVIVATVGWIHRRTKKTSCEDIQSKVVWMLVIWWILDTAFIWISPRSYEQYYLPLCGSAAVLSGYAAWKWQMRLKQSRNKIPAVVSGVIAAIVLISLSVPIFTGFRYSPDTGSDYIKNYGYKRRGFAEALNRVKQSKGQVFPWQQVGDYIRTHSNEKDTIYVWGWVPGIYVQAQRMAPINRPFYGDMHITPPQSLASMINQMETRFEQNPPKFIVDSRKIHFPNDRPPLELWPHTYSKGNPQGTPLPNNPNVTSQYDALYKKLLAEKFDPRQKEYSNLPTTSCWLQYAPWSKAMPDEAKRYDAMEPLRDFVMNHYRIVGHYGMHVLFEYIGKPDSGAQ